MQVSELRNIYFSQRLNNMEKEEITKKQWEPPYLTDMDVNNSSKDLDTTESGATFRPS